MLAADTQDSLRDGEVIEWTDQDDDEIDTTEFAYNGEAQYVIPSLVKPRENSAFEFPKEGYKVAYYEKTATKDRHASTDTPSDRSVDGYVLDYIRDANTIVEEGTYVAVVPPRRQRHKGQRGRADRIHHRGQQPRERQDRQGVRQEVH